MTAEYRIEYSIQQSTDDSEQDFQEIGFGSSATWDDIDAALYAMSSDIQNRLWETTPGMPDPRRKDQDQ